MKYIELHSCSAFSFLGGASCPEDLAARAAELELPAVALLDRDGAVSARYKLRGLPTTYLIDCHGNTVGWAAGPQEWTSDAVRTLLVALLSDPSCG